MRIEVKLYAFHDMDLVALYKAGMVSFPETTKQILNSYARKEVYKIKMNEANEERLARYYPKSNYRKFYHYHIELNEKDDKDAISLMHSITPGCRNNFIKVLLRQYIGAVFTPEYSVTGSSDTFDEMAELFRGILEEKEVKIKKETKNKTKKRKFKHIEDEDNNVITKSEEIKEVKNEKSITKNNNFSNDEDLNLKSNEIINANNNIDNSIDSNSASQEIDEKQNLESDNVNNIVLNEASNNLNTNKLSFNNQSNTMDLQKDDSNNKKEFLTDPMAMLNDENTNETSESDEEDVDDFLSQIIEEY